MESRRSTIQRQRNSGSSELHKVLETLRRLHTTVGELTCSVGIEHRVDVMFVCETFPDDKSAAGPLLYPGVLALGEGGPLDERQGRGLLSGHSCETSGTFHQPTCVLVDFRW